MKEREKKRLDITLDLYLGSEWNLKMKKKTLDQSSEFEYNA